MKGGEKMIDEKILLQELDEMIKIQQKSVERAEQGSNEAVVYLESRELAAYMKVRNLIKEKSAKEAATSKGTNDKKLSSALQHGKRERTMGKMILITTDNEVKELEYPDEGLKSWKKLKEHIGNRCELIEHVQPKRLYTEIGAGIEVKNVPGSKVSMLVDEEFYFHCDETKLNKIASWLYETDRHGYPILGNALIIGEKYGNAGIEFCEMSEEQFDLVFPKLKELGKRFKDAGD